MIAVDTNVLVRFLVDDTSDARQCQEARSLVAGLIAADERIFVPLIVVVETAWVLRVGLRVPRAEIADLLEAVLDAEELVVEGAASVGIALRRFRAEKGDLSDYLIAESGKAAGCSVVYTFDQALLRSSGFRAPTSTR